MNRPDPRLALALTGLTPILKLQTDLAKSALVVVLQNLLVLDQKQQDYGSTNLTKFGTFGVVVRANDKLERIVNLIKQQDRIAKNEPLSDSFLDLANYAIIGYLMQSGKWPITTVPAPQVGDHGEIE